MTLSKIISIITVCTLVLGQANAQTEIKIKDFSKKYYAKVVTLPDSSSYYIRVYDKTTNKKMIESVADQISESLLEDDQLIPNVKELPYGDQSVLIYEDFNFDGIKDFAIMNGFQSCYGGPSFDIYLWIKDAFKFSDSFSELSNNYCGMFQVNTNRKRITTMTKSGCCWHQYSEFIVKDNTPVPVKVVEESVMSNRTPSFVEVITKEWIGGKEKQKVKMYMPYDEVDTIFSFKLKKNNKMVCVFSLDTVLYYSLLRQDGSIEFYYPQLYFDEKKDQMVIHPIHYSPQKTTLGFQNKDVYYEVYEAAGKQVGVRVKMQDSVLNLEGDPKSIKGSLMKPVIKSNKNIN
jgi:hypothetical protein